MDNLLLPRHYSKFVEYDFVMSKNEDFPKYKRISWHCQKTTAECVKLYIRNPYTGLLTNDIVEKYYWMGQDFDTIDHLTAAIHKARKNLA